MSKLLYLEGHSGISGDMTVAALLDLGASAAKLDAVLHSLDLPFHYHAERGNSYSIAGCRFKVHHHEAAPQEESYTEHHHEHGHDHGHRHDLAHEHSHEHHHDHVHRHLAEVEHIIDGAAMTDSARALAKRIFRIVAEAEAKAHGVPVESVHFHEVGAVDSIVDIIAIAVLAEDLGADGCVVTGLHEGHGTIMCQHGELPVPVPAVLNIAEAHGIALHPTAVHGEMVTPTGIAAAAALRTQSTLPAAYRVLKSGIGLGSRDFGKANFLRALLIEDSSDPEQVYAAECNIDDSTPESLAYAHAKLMAAGALDAWFTPCTMKKGRPAVVLSLLCTADKLETLEELVLRHTTAIGIRHYAVERRCMERRALTVATPYGTVSVKESRYKDIRRCQPEYESVAAAADAAGVPFDTVFTAAKNAAEAL